MRYAQQYLSQIKRSMTRFLPRASPLLLERAQLSMLRALVGRESAGGATDDASLAVLFFRKRLPVTGFLTPDEAKHAVMAYGRDKAAWRQDLLAEADRLCALGLPVYALQAGPLNGGLDWSALRTGPQGDRLYRLRPHRFGFLPRLAMASCLGADCLPALHATLAAWLRWAETAAGAAEAYFSNLVVIYRLLAISWAVPFVAARAQEGDKTAARICLQLFRILAADCRHLQPRLGKSAPNNHLLADRFAAWLLAVCYSELAPPAEDPAALERAWQAELARQFYSDGTNFEQSLHYHDMGCELALAYLVIVLRRKTPPSNQVLTMIAAMLRFQAALADRHGNGFALGDATDDPLFPLDGGGGWAGGAWRILYRALFARDFPPTAETAAGAERAYWLLTALRGLRPALLAVALEPIGELAAFPVGGYISFRDEARDDYLLFRSGPRKGSIVFPGHAMSDLLTVYWNTGGKPVLEPTGTYSYAINGPATEGPPLPRRYFRSPAAHNGLLLYGHDPLGASQSRFRHYDSGARVETRWRALAEVLAWAEGRLEEAGPLNGWRRGVLRLPGRYTLVYDRLLHRPGATELACHWQFAPEARVVLRSPRQAIAKLSGLTAYLCASEGIAAIDCVKGRQEPAAGWLSRRYGQLQAAPQLLCSLRPGTRTVAFIIGLDDSEDLPAVAVLADEAEGTVITLRHGESVTLCVFGRYCGRLPDPAVDLDYDGDVLWLAFAGDSCSELRTLGLRRLASDSLGFQLAAADVKRDCPGWRRLVGDVGAEGLCGRWVRQWRPRSVSWQERWHP